MLDLSDYTITEKFHEGSATLLYRGQRRADSAPVVVKLPSSDYPTSREVARLRHEYALLRELALPGIAKAYELVRVGRGAALVMEDLRAESLSKVMHRRQLTIGESLHVGVELAAALERIHAHGVLHKDLKPANILLNEATRKVYLVDFGIAARLTGERRAAPSTEFLEGTLAYMSPEQTGRLLRQLDARSDLYSFGVVLFELLTGVLPFAGSDAADFIYSHVARTPPSPQELRPELPAVLAKLVLRLLNKAAEERYQSARGLHHDLKHCLTEWLHHQRIAEFPLGCYDQTAELHLTQRLYGRKGELALLTSTLHRVRSGAVELTLLSGASGVGKSALASELHLPIASQGGFFLVGRFEEQQRGRPLGPILDTVRAAVRQLLTFSPAALLFYQMRLRSAVGVVGQLLVEMIPELERIIGAQPAVPAVGPQEAQNRFVLLCQSVLRSLAGAQHPLLLFFDDLHFADAASLQLIKQLMLDPHAHHLMVVGAVSSAALDDTQPLGELRLALIRERIPVHEIALFDLALADVTSLVADTLGLPPARVAELAGELVRKTHGNPFFISQLLRVLHRKGILFFSAESGSWSWDAERLASMVVTDNVAAFMIAKLQRLNAVTLAQLSAAACIGQQFELKMLARITAIAPADCAVALGVAVHEGLLQPLGTSSAALAPGTSQAPSGNTMELGVPPVGYRFTHDRIHRAAYQRLEPLQRQRLHLGIGRYLEAQAPPDERTLFDIVGHLNQAAALLADPAERLALARLNQRAGEHTLTTSSYVAAAGYFAAGMELVGATGWAADRELYFSLHLAHAHCEVLCGRLAAAQSELDALGQKPLTRRERTLVQLRLADLLFTRGEYAQSLQVGLAGLALFDIKLPAPSDDRAALLPAAMAAVAQSLGTRRITDLVHEPVLTDADLLAAAELFSGLTTTVYIADPELFPFLILRHIRFVFEHGPSPGTDHVCSVYAFLLVAGFGQPAAAREYAALALALNQRFHDARTRGRVQVSLAMLGHRLHPLRDGLPLLTAGLQASREGGDYSFLALGYQTLCLTKFDVSDDLRVALAENEQALVVMKQTKDVLSGYNLLLCRQATAALLGKTSAPNSLSSHEADHEVDETKLAAELRAQGVGPPMVVYLGKRLLLDYLFGAQPDSWSLALEAARWEQTALGLKWAEDLQFFACLHLIAGRAAAAPEEQKIAAARIARYHEYFGELAKSAPDNYGYRERLIAAERARSEQRIADAVIAYDAAVAAALAAEFPLFGALCCERAARFHLEGGRQHLARVYMSEAYYAYVSIGAARKAEQLAAKHPELIHAEVRGLDFLRTETGRATTSSSSSRRGIEERLDIDAVLRAAKAIASEIELGKVIDRLMRVVAASAAAQRGVLILERPSGLCVEAVLQSDPETVETGLGTAIEKSTDLPLSVIHYVVRTKEAVVLSAASPDPRFAADPYLLAHKPKSLLCLPLEHRGRLSGLLYLENNLTAVDFSRTRIELVRILAAQAAISVENALLFRAADQAAERSRRTNELLESQVQERTGELQRKNAELEESNRQLQKEFAERSRAQQERSAIQEQMLRVQQERVAELSSPLIPITDQIVVMPLIGTMDAARAALVLEAVLDGVQRLRVQVVIIDITGIRQVDSATAEMLVRTARALRLLGAQSILTGIRAEVAQTLVGLGADLTLLQTRGSLQSAMTYALQLTR